MRFLILIFSLNAIVLGAEVDEIVNFALNSKLVHTIYCHEQNTGVTTVAFPDEISGIYGARVDVKFNEKKPNPFLLSFTPGSAYFTIKSLAANQAQGAINVVYKKEIYVLHLKTVKKGYSSVSFRAPKQVKQVGNSAYKNKAVSTSLLLSMLDKAKAYHLIKKHYPAQVEGISLDTPTTVMEYSTHQILLKEVIRFESQDTLFFHIQVKNTTFKELRYKPKDFAVNVGDKIFYAALTDASGVVPAEAVRTVWFCVTGTKVGGRNNLSVKNNWKVLLNVSRAPKALNKPKKKTAEEIIPRKPRLRILREIQLQEVQP